MANSATQTDREIDRSARMQVLDWIEPFIQQAEMRVWIIEQLTHEGFEDCSVEVDRRLLAISGLAEQALGQLKLALCGPAEK